jgi:Bax protein
MRLARPAYLVLLLALVALGSGLSWWLRPAPAALPASGQETSSSAIATMLDTRRLSDDQRDALTGALPAILRENARIVAERQRVQDIASSYLRDITIDEADFNWLKDLADEYQLHPQSRSDSHFFGELLTRVDVVPPSLVLAHMAQSWRAVSPPGMGDSVNALTFRRQSCHEDLCLGFGMHAGHNSMSLAAAVTAVAVSDDSVRNYMLRLNTDDSYADFRLQRLGLRNRGEEIKGLPLVSSLRGSALRDEGYVDQLRSLITINDLQDMD